MTPDDEAAWQAFTAEHAEIIGYDLNGAFMPVKPGNARAQALAEETAARLGQRITPIYGWKEDRT